ncbi:MAG: LEA type 2 family protein [Bacteroidales bacterium]|jgi:hypothetical protein|nr:LEA type 2 family protein [Bacteroidota bacterium]NLO00396.1 LEA type 2 family protein [Bacteroidales bacterium]
MMKRIVPSLLIILVLTALSACSRVKDIKITSCGVESFTPKGLRSVDAVLALGIDNPSIAFTIEGLDGVVKYRGEELAIYTADTVSVDRKSARVYDLPCSATLSDNMSLPRILSLMRKGNLEGFTTDIVAKVKLRSGVGTTLKFKDIDLQQLME